jgi:hypothetical protein
MCVFNFQDVFHISSSNFKYIYIVHVYVSNGCHRPPNDFLALGWQILSSILLMGGSMGSLNGSTPIAGWFMMENPNITWMMTGGSPILGNIHIIMNRIADVHDVHVNTFCLDILTGTILGQ